jgi:hypothetical protein
MRELVIAGVVGVVMSVPVSPAVAGLFEYAADDGSGSINIGPSFDAEMLWGNYFAAEPGFGTITAVSIAFGSIEAGRPIDLLVFDDPDDDGDPGNAVLVAQHAAVTMPGGLNEFIDYAIDPVNVTGGFFIAAKMQVTNADRPARLDPQTISGQSWLYFDDPITGIDLDDLGGSPFVLNMDDAPFPGTWMVRATAVPGPGAGAGIPGMLLLAGAGGRRRSRRTSGKCGDGAR